ncbi:MAG: tryptophan synthase subunit alpha [Planctomycetes bacterium]|nr:tryptophan synthase subunit alpha [Planctomycetota bacterium]
MNRIEKIFAELRAKKRKALMPFVVAGFPAPGTLASTLEALQKAGSSIVEIGIPFSDPIADGPVIAQAMHHSLLKGTTPESILKEVAHIRPRIAMGLVAMVSVSIVQRLGNEKFIRALAASGFDGIIIPDLDLDAARPIVVAAESSGMALAMLISPLTPQERIKKIVAMCRGFVYLLSRAGITGEQGGAPDIDELVRRVRAETTLPLAVGFGISTPEHVRAVVRFADAAIVGSALVRSMGQGEPDQALSRAEKLTRDLVEAL